MIKEWISNNVESKNIEVKKISICNILLFILLFFTTMLYQYHIGVEEYYYDSAYYFGIADGVFENGFNFLNYGSTYRGYLYPMLVAIFTRLFYGISSYTGVRILGSLFVAFTFSYALPKLLDRNNQMNLIGYLRIAIAYVSFMYLWGNLSSFPLSDLPASFFMIMGAVFLKNAQNEVKIWRLVGCSIVAGIFLYAAYNTRVAFFYGIAISVIYNIICLWHEKKKLCIALISLIIGMSVVALPQTILNAEYYNDYLPRVHTEVLYGGDHNLQAQQVFWGLTMARYETYVGDNDIYKYASVVFEDQVGKKIVDDEGLQIENFSIFDIFRLFVKYPQDIMTIYVRHFVTLLTPAFLQEYITTFHVGKGVVSGLSIGIWLILGIYLLYGKDLVKWNLWIDVVAICFPCLLQALGAPERRFFIPVYLIGYYIVLKVIDYKELAIRLKGSWVRVIICSALIYLLWITVYADVLTNVKDDTLIINDNYYEYNLDE